MASWSAEETERIAECIRAGKTAIETWKEFTGRSQYAVEHRYRVIKRELDRAKEPSRATLHAEAMQRIRHEAEHPPIDTGDKQRIRELEAELACLREQKKWETHSNSASSTGGVLTIRASDHHFADANHLLSCWRQLQEKMGVIIGNYKPDRIKLIAGDDWIAGRGIYKEQDLDCAVSDVDQQIGVGAIKAREWLEAIRGVSSAPITWHMLRGNHDHSGKTSLTTSMFFQMRALTEDIPDVQFKLHWDRAIINLADKGYYNVLAMHGFGGSKISPNGTAFIDATKDIMLRANRKFESNLEHIRRVLSGHTHWLSVGLQRIVDIFFDTTGGMQRNTRVQLGMNARPVGTIVYISPQNSEHNILKPIEVSPDPDCYEREMADPHLASANRADCAECLVKYQDLLAQRGLSEPVDAVGITEGRW